LKASNEPKDTGLAEKRSPVCALRICKDIRRTLGSIGAALQEGRKLCMHRKNLHRRQQNLNNHMS